MSNISRLTSLAAAGAGGGDGFVLERTNSAGTFTPLTTKVAVDSNGDIITVSTLYGAGGHGWVVYKTDADGTEIWSKSLTLSAVGHVPKLHKLGDITTDSSNNIIIVGEADPSTTVYRNTSYIIKLTSAGAVSWQHNVRMASYGEWFTGVAVDSSDNVYVCGTMADDQNGTFYGAQLKKYNSSGVLQLTNRIYQSQSHFYVTGIAIDSSNDLYVCGNIVNPSDGSRQRALLIKMNSSFTAQWKARVDPPASYGHHSIYGVTVDSSDNIYINGRDLQGGAVPWVLKFNTLGVIQWQQKMVVSGQYITSNPTNFYSNMTSDSSDNIYYVQGSSTDKFLVTSLDTSGSVRFALFISDPNSVNTYRGYGCAVTADDELILGGSVDSSTIADETSLTIKMPNDGVSGTFGAFEFSDLSTTVTATTYTTTSTTSGGGDSDIATITTTAVLTGITIAETITSL